MSTTNKRQRNRPRIPSFTLGCDPELFLLDKSTNSFIQPRTVNGPGTKETPAPISDGAWQYDGLAIELNPCASGHPEVFVDQVLSCLQTANAIVARQNKNYTLVADAVAFFDKEYYDKNVPDVAKELGCEPDFNAYLNGSVNPFPKSPSREDNRVMRTGGGHLHLGFINIDKQNRFDKYDKNYMSNISRLVRNLDHFLMYHSAKWEEPSERRLMYGKPGAFRPKDYGLEYRSLSNEWLKYRELYSWLFETSFVITNLTADGYDLTSCDPATLHKNTDVPVYESVWRSYTELALREPPLTQRLKQRT